MRLEVNNAVRSKLLQHFYSFFNFSCLESSYRVDERVA